MVTKCPQHNKRRKFYRSVIRLLMILLQDLLNHLYLLIASHTWFPNEHYFPRHELLCPTHLITDYSGIYSLAPFSPLPKQRKLPINTLHLH